MKAIYVLLLVSLAIESFADDRCTLYTAITNYGLDNNEKAKFMCLFSELASVSRPQDHYGHFAISIGWCYDPRRPTQNRCQINCLDLGDPTFRNDIRCAYRILLTEGITAWGGVAPKCMGSNLFQYIPQCV